MALIVLTGGTSGFGAIASERLARSGGDRLILGARRRTPVAESLPLDLAALESVRAFAASLHDRLGDEPIDALVLNAGLVRPDVTARTVDGFETAFAVNHLAHYLLLRLLMPMLADGATAARRRRTAGTPRARPGRCHPATYGGRARLHRVQAVHRSHRPIAVRAPR